MRRKSNYEDEPRLIYIKRWGYKVVTLSFDDGIKIEFVNWTLRRFNNRSHTENGFYYRFVILKDFLK